jgi:hypothetical protein
MNNYACFYCKAGACWQVRYVLFCSVCMYIYNYIKLYFTTYMVAMKEKTVKSLKN